MFVIYKTLILEELSKLEITIKNLYDLENCKQSVLVKQNHAKELLQLIEQEGLLQDKIKAIAIELMNITSYTAFKSFRELIFSSEDIELVTKYNNILALESEVKFMNELNSDLLLELIKYNTYDLNLLRKEEVDISYAIPSSCINRKKLNEFCKKEVSY